MKRKRVWRWYDTPMAAVCKGCKARWQNMWTASGMERCPKCGYTPEDAREQERLDRAEARRRRAAERDR